VRNEFAPGGMFGGIVGRQTSPWRFVCRTFFIDFVSIKPYTAYTIDFYRHMATLCASQGRERKRHHPPGFWLDSRQWSSTATIEVPDCWQLCPSRLLANNGKYMFADHYRHVYHIIYSSNRSLQHLDLGGSGSNLGSFFDLFRSFERHCHLSFCCS
jgi:hypothetical protein